ncbi:MAG: Acetylornithine deacetylase/Succinyl-diaminopimelate desuccinylase and related deacylases [uncultured Gemmatimonadetes bacterium]|uniref:Acetylornithine deacetylase/Succinyl-diaminopimelate desuccinylase and related deacylases n=1 Tax=uncultured Gemmatimonadota bacterium TaxID=203437 RepID=A0A6J4K7V2_9BACT|nr:MAG: Acetylornithine deacetylase/Succinyl-diaminopimelate desuccinylase and related deacylases [uncultured Gemmatimonadota bacterium]
MAVSEYLQRNRERSLEELNEWLRIPSISAKSEHRDDTARAAEWLAGRMRAVGLQTVDVVATAGNPVVVGEWRGAPEGAPTLLVYGHYDVQPPEPLDEWNSPPFEPVVKDGRIYARGSVDDKGQVYLHLKAVEAHLAENGALPVNVVFLVEGEEEVGSPNLGKFLQEHVERLRCDAVMISDTTMFAPGLPSITVGLRGLAYMEVRVQGPATDLHSGAYGGAVVNPALALARILSQLHDADGRITIPGFYDRVRELTQEQRDAIAALPFEEEGLREEVGAPALGGEKGFGSVERIWARPTLDVNGLLSGYTGEGAKTVLPARAMAKVSMRLVPNQDYKEIERVFIDHVKSLAPEGVTVEVEALHGGQPWFAEPEGRLFDAAKRALARAYGRDPVMIREGGSIPIVQSFQETLGAPVVLIGFGLPGENAHAPNEWMSVDNFHQGAEAIAALYEELR